MITFEDGLKNLAKFAVGVPLVLMWFGWILTFGLVIASAVYVLARCFGRGFDEDGDPTGSLDTFLQFNCPLFFAQTEGPPARNDSPASRRSLSFLNREQR